MKSFSIIILFLSFNAIALDVSYKAKLRGFEFSANDEVFHFSSLRVKMNFPITKCSSPIINKLHKEFKKKLKTKITSSKKEKTNLIIVNKKSFNIVKKSPLDNYLSRFERSVAYVKLKIKVDCE